MTELSISPLARRMAEENNVDWRTLTGSDDGGGVSERDVLNYLEGVMLGTKPVAPTPEPLPEGVTAWAEEPQHTNQEQSPWTAKATFVDATAPNEPVILESSPAAPAEPSASADDGAAERPTEDAEAVYRELFAELGTLKKAAATVEEARAKEREAAQQLQAELKKTRETLTGRETELTKLQTQLADREATLRTHRQGADEAQLELTRLQGTLEQKDTELTQVPALKEQLEAQAGKLKSLSEQLAEADARAQNAQVEAEALRAANVGLEQTVAELKDRAAIIVPEPQRPWWKLWG